MCVVPSPLLPSNNSVQISVKHCTGFQSTVFTRTNTKSIPTQHKQHTGSPEDLAVMLAHALQLNSVTTGLKCWKKKILWLYQIHLKCSPKLHLTTLNMQHLIYNKTTWQTQDVTFVWCFKAPIVNKSMSTDLKLFQKVGKKYWSGKL